MGSAATSYDPRVIERFAEQLLAKADSVRVMGAVGGGILGVLFGAVPLTPLGNAWPIPATFGFATILLGALVGILIGYVLGEGRAFRYRVQAQMALFQLDIERKVETAVLDAARLVVAPAQPAPAVQAPVSPAPAPAPASPVAEAPPLVPPTQQLPPPLPPLLRRPDPEPTPLPPLSLEPDAQPGLPPLSPPIAL